MACDRVDPGDSFVGGGPTPKRCSLGEFGPRILRGWRTACHRPRQLRAPSARLSPHSGKTAAGKTHRTGFLPGSNELERGAAFMSLSLRGGCSHWRGQPGCPRWGRRRGECADEAGLCEVPGAGGQRPGVCVCVISKGALMWAGSPDAPHGPPTFPAN